MSRSATIASLGPPRLDSHVPQAAPKPRLHRRVRTKVKHHYFKRMPNKKRYRVLIWAIFFICSAVVAAQLLYPTDRALPFVRIHDTQVGFKKEADIAFQAQDLFRDMHVRLTAGDDSAVEAHLPTIGGEIDTPGVIHAASNYPFWQRFIPFSILMHWRSIDTAEVTYNATLLDEFAKSASKKLTTQPKNARLSIEKGQLIAIDDKPGQIVSADQVKRTVERYQYDLGKMSTIDLSAAEESADTTASDLSAVRDDAERALDRAVVITTNDHTITPTREQRAEWLVIAQNDDDEVVLQFDKAALKKYLVAFNKTVGTSAGTTVIGVVDGQEVRRENGKEGRELKYDPLMRSIEAWIMHGEGASEITAELRVVKPDVRYEGRYSASQDGLRAYVKDAARDQNASIVVRQLNGKRWQASADDTVTMPSASTYKLFVAWMLFTKMNQGSIGWNDPVLDTNVSNCFDRMTIASTNPCAEHWISQFGRTNLNNFLHSRGYSNGTSFTQYAAVHTTARDLAKFMESLERGENISGDQRTRLLHSLSIHPYRQGVPSGSAGTVQDKVGFLWDYTHDAAIVHHPKGTYVIVVMTKGRSYGTIAEITRQVEQIMYN